MKISNFKKYTKYNFTVGAYNDPYEKVNENSIQKNGDVLKAISSVESSLENSDAIIDTDGFNMAVVNKLCEKGNFTCARVYVCDKYKSHTFEDFQNSQTKENYTNLLKHNDAQYKKCISYILTNELKALRSEAQKPDTVNQSIDVSLSSSIK
jgi:hypothetical protein